MVFRAPPRKRQKRSPHHSVTLYSLSPIVDMNGGGELTVVRVDQPGESIEVALDGGQLFRGTFFDFLSANRSLTAGGVYRATLGGKSVVFKIDEHAAPGRTPVITRLLRIAAASRRER
jgi:hypothetical protein